MNIRFRFILPSLMLFLLGCQGAKESPKQLPISGDDIKRVYWIHSPKKSGHCPYPFQYFRAAGSRPWKNLALEFVEVDSGSVEQKLQEHNARPFSLMLLEGELVQGAFAKLKLPRSARGRYVLLSKEQKAGQLWVDLKEHRQLLAAFCRDKNCTMLPPECQKLGADDANPKASKWVVDLSGGLSSSSPRQLNLQVNWEAVFSALLLGEDQVVISPSRGNVKVDISPSGDSKALSKEREWLKGWFMENLGG